ncbi:MAG TPA: transcription elongation factor GreA [Actinocrinis sp.]|nr:transcription elongation factor GreA [Actinocrinis sp.]
MTQTSANVTWLTQEAYDRLKAELDYLQGQGQVDIAKIIEAAREEGDLKENSGYHAAKEEQSKMEARRLQLRQLLENAQVGVAPTVTGVAAPGMVVTVAFDGDDEDTLEFLIGSREDAGASMEVYSPQSPLGAALVGRKIGESSQYELPNGSKMTVKLLSARPYGS